MKNIRSSLLRIIICLGLISIKSTSHGSNNQLHLSMAGDHENTYKLSFATHEQEEFRSLRYTINSKYHKTTTRIHGPFHPTSHDLKKKTSLWFMSMGPFTIGDQVEYNLTTSLCQHVEKFVVLGRNVPTQQDYRLAFVGDMAILKPSSPSGISFPALKEGVKQKKIDALINLGDLAYDFQGKYGEQYMNDMHDITRSVPLFPILGNHEYKNFNNYENYQQYFQDVKSGVGQASKSFTNEYYSIDIGGVHFVFLNFEFYTKKNELLSHHCSSSISSQSSLEPQHLSRNQSSPSSVLFYSSQSPRRSSSSSFSSYSSASNSSSSYSSSSSSSGSSSVDCRYFLNEKQRLKQAEWFKNDLKSVDRKKIPHVILISHRPLSELLTSNKNNQASFFFIREILPLISTHIDFYICGHVHGYYYFPASLRIFDNQYYPIPPWIIAGCSGNEKNDYGKEKYKNIPSFPHEFQSFQYGYGILNLQRNGKLMWTYGITATGKDLHHHPISTNWTLLHQLKKKRRDFFRKSARFFLPKHGTFNWKSYFHPMKLLIMEYGADQFPIVLSYDWNE